MTHTSDTEYRLDRNGDVVAIIEDHALSIELSEWVIDTVLTQMETWDHAGLSLPVSVNVGAHQLQKLDVIDRLRTLLAAHPDVGAERLELEILESSALEDVDKISGVMHACHEIGVRFALDDFGTGYSSLTYLKRLPAAQIKIDRSFVHDMLDDPGERFAEITPGRACFQQGRAATSKDS